MLDDPAGLWELHRGELWRRPPMTTAHEHTTRRLGGRLIRRLDEAEFDVAINGGRLRTSSIDYYVPDVCVIPRRLLRPLLEKPGTFEAVDQPVPLVVEI